MAGGIIIKILHTSSVKGKLKVEYLDLGREIRRVWQY